MSDLRAPALHARHQRLAAGEASCRAGRRRAVEGSIQIVQRAGRELEQSPAAGDRGRRRNSAAAVLEEKESLERPPELVEGAVQVALVPGSDHPSSLNEPVADPP